MECRVDLEIGAYLDYLLKAIAVLDVSLPDPEYLLKVLTAVGVILTAISSFANRRKLGTMDGRIIAAAIAAGMAAEKAAKAAENTEVIVAKADEVKAQLAEVREAAVAVNAEVIDRIKNGGNN